MKNRNIPNLPLPRSMTRNPPKEPCPVLEQVRFPLKSYEGTIVSLWLNNGVSFRCYVDRFENGILTGWRYRNGRWQMLRLSQNEILCYF